MAHCRGHVRKILGEFSQKTGDKWAVSNQGGTQSGGGVFRQRLGQGACVS